MEQISWLRESTIALNAENPNPSFKRIESNEKYWEHSHNAMSELPSLNLKDNLESDFLRELCASGLVGLFFSFTATALEERQGKQVFCSIPQWSGVSLLSSPISSPWLADTSPVQTEFRSAQRAIWFQCIISEFFLILSNLNNNYKGAPLTQNHPCYHQHPLPIHRYIPNLSNIKCLTMLLIKVK